VTVNLIKKAMQESGASLFLIDGFPRNFDNLTGWQRVMGDEVRMHRRMGGQYCVSWRLSGTGLWSGQVDVKFVLFYDTSEEVMEKRLLARCGWIGARVIGVLLQHSLSVVLLQRQDERAVR